ncbi:MAG: hypothetical protein ACRDK4_15075 [Solirubrobacteraceae bacterium]
MEDLANAMVAPRGSGGSDTDERQSAGCGLAEVLAKSVSRRLWWRHAATVRLALHLLSQIVGRADRGR